jgi:hypothetical protein
MGMLISSSNKKVFSELSWPDSFVISVLISSSTSSDTLSVLYLSSQYCVHILYSCWTLSTGHRSLTISSYEILNFLNMTYTTTEICKSSSSTRNVKYKHPSHIIINKKASWKETKVRLPLCNLVG